MSKLSEKVPTKRPAHMSSGYELSVLLCLSSKDWTISRKQYGATKPAMTLAHSNRRAANMTNDVQSNVRRSRGSLHTIEYDSLLSPVEILCKLPATNHLLPCFELARFRRIGLHSRRITNKRRFGRIGNEKCAFFRQSHVFRSICIWQMW